MGSGRMTSAAPGFKRHGRGLGGPPRTHPLVPARGDVALEAEQVAAIPLPAGGERPARGLMEQLGMRSLEPPHSPQLPRQSQVAGRMIDQQRRARERPEIAGALTARHQIARLQQMRELVRDREVLEAPWAHRRCMAIAAA